MNHIYGPNSVYETSTSDWGALTPAPTLPMNAPAQKWVEISFPKKCYICLEETQYLLASSSLLPICAHCARRYRLGA